MSTKQTQTWKDRAQAAETALAAQKADFTEREELHRKELEAHIRRTVEIQAAYDQRHRDALALADENEALRDELMAKTVEIERLRGYVEHANEERPMPPPEPFEPHRRRYSVQRSLDARDASVANETAQFGATPWWSRRRAGG